MKCKVCNAWAEPILTLPNQPSSVRDFSGADTPITLNIVQCSNCNLIQLDNIPVSDWEIQTRTGYTKDIQLAIERYPDTSLLLHYLEHVPDPNKLIQNLSDKVLITVPYYDENVVEFCIDHLMYFTPDTLKFALEKNGFCIRKIEILDDGLTIAVVAERSDYAVWGAGHQALAAMSIYKMKPIYVIDSSPIKQKGVTPVTHFPIISPSEFYDNPTPKLVVMAGGYNKEVIEEVKKELGNEYPIYILAKGWPYGLVREGTKQEK